MQSDVKAAARKDSVQNIAYRSKWRKAILLNKHPKSDGIVSDVQL